MNHNELMIVKRDGTRKPFEIDKIKQAISKSFLSVGAFATEDDLTQILSHIRFADGMSVEQIQNQVETALMKERYFEVAKSYILYRQKHTEDREVRHCLVEAVFTGDEDAIEDLYQAIDKFMK